MLWVPKARPLVSIVSHFNIMCDVDTFVGIPLQAVHVYSQYSSLISCVFLYIIYVWCSKQDTQDPSSKTSLSMCQPRSKEAFWSRVETFSVSLLTLVTMLWNTNFYFLANKIMIIIIIIIERVISSRPMYVITDQNPIISIIITTIITSIITIFNIIITITIINTTIIISIITIITVFNIMIIIITTIITTTPSPTSVNLLLLHFYHDHYDCCTCISKSLYKIICT